MKGEDTTQHKSEELQMHNHEDVSKGNCVILLEHQWKNVQVTRGVVLTAMCF